MFSISLLRLINFYIINVIFNFNIFVIGIHAFKYLYYLVIVALLPKLISTELLRFCFMPAVGDCSDALTARLNKFHAGEVISKGEEKPYAGP